MREQWRGHKHFDYTLKFCEKYDMPAFDTDLKYMPLAEFEPVVRRVLYNPKKSVYVPNPAA